MTFVQDSWAHTFNSTALDLRPLLDTWTDRLAFKPGNMPKDIKIMSARGDKDGQSGGVGVGCWKHHMLTQDSNRSRWSFGCKYDPRSPPVLSGGAKVKSSMCGVAVTSMERRRLICSYMLQLSKCATGKAKTSHVKSKVFKLF